MSDDDPLDVATKIAYSGNTPPDTATPIQVQRAITEHPFLTAGLAEKTGVFYDPYPDLPFASTPEQNTDRIPSRGLIERLRDFIASRERYPSPKVKRTAGDIQKIIFVAMAGVLAVVGSVVFIVARNSSIHFGTVKTYSPEDDPLYSVKRDKKIAAQREATQKTKDQATDKTIDALKGDAPDWEAFQAANPPIGPDTKTARLKMPTSVEWTNRSGEKVRIQLPRDTVVQIEKQMKNGDVVVRIPSLPEALREQTGIVFSGDLTPAEKKALEPQGQSPRQEPKPEDGSRVPGGFSGSHSSRVVPDKKSASVNVGQEPYRDAASWTRRVTGFHQARRGLG